MKKILITLIALVTLISCEKLKENEFVIKGTVEKELDGRKVFLKKVDGNQYINIDSTEVSNGKFSFRGFSETPRLNYVVLDSIRLLIPIIIEEGNISIRAFKDSIAGSIMSGTETNDQFYELISMQRKFGKQITDVRIEFKDAQRSRDSVTINSLSELYQELVEKAQKIDPEFMDKYPESFVSLLLLEGMYARQLKSPQETKAIFDKFPVKVQNSEVGTKLNDALIKIIEVEKNTSIGSVAPNFSAPNPSGDILNLNDLKGKVTIIDFWAAWCKPCRVENPNVVAMYEKYHEKGLNIVGVSLDRREQDWLKAIEEDQLPWNHVSNLKSWQDPIAQLYNVRAIPATYVLDAEGKIVAKNLRGPALEAKVDELLSL